ncbi:MAG: superoxide dismutase [Pseudomonadota bacterium]
MAIELPPLPYSRDALEPHISENTLNYHFGKHHQAYVNKLNDAIGGTGLEGKSLEDIVTAVSGDQSKSGIFNNAAQVWNHTFYWHSMTPGGGGAPTGKIAELITRDFGSYDEFKAAFKAKGATQFGSGWAWLVMAGGKLHVTNTLNAHTPVEDADATPLLTMDVWEHAYYLDYQNDRPGYIDHFLDKLVNWDFANANLPD